MYFNPVFGRLIGLEPSNIIIGWHEQQKGIETSGRVEQSRLRSPTSYEQHKDGKGEL